MVSMNPVTFNNYLSAKTTVSKANQLGKRSAKPQLLIVTVDSVESKAFILRSCTNLRKADPANHYHKIYVTPDLTPAQREANLQLRTKLEEMNKDGKAYVIKDGRIRLTACTMNEHFSKPLLHGSYPHSLQTHTISNQADFTSQAIFFNNTEGSSVLNSEPEPQTIVTLRVKSYQHQFSVSGK